MLVAVVSASSPGREPRIAVGGIVRLCEVYLPSTLVDGDALAGYHHLMRVEGEPPGGRPRWRRGAAASGGEEGRAAPRVAKRASAPPSGGPLRHSHKSGEEAPLGAVRTLAL